VRREVRKSLKTELERLWRTGEIYLEKPDLASERRNVVHYLRNVFPNAIPELDRRLMVAWEDVGFDSGLLHDPSHRPSLRFGNWVGGDRDGHPLVTATVTRETLAELRTNALELVEERLTELARRLSLSEFLQTPPAALPSRIESAARRLGKAGTWAVSRNPDEPWRQFVNLMIARLPSGAPPASTAPHTYDSADELEDDLSFLRKQLLHVGADRIARRDLTPVLRTVQTFGFHLAALDIREPTMSLSKSKASRRGRAPALSQT